MESTVGYNADNETINTVGPASYKEAIKKQLNDEVRKIADIEMQKIAQEIIEEHKIATRKMVEECKSAIRQCAEEEKMEMIL